jgi:hypothetical protein
MANLAIQPELESRSTLPATLQISPSIVQESVYESSVSDTLGQLMTILIPPPT